MKTNTSKMLTLLSAGTLIGLSGCKQNSQVQQRPNIIFIMSDDHAYQAISAYGDRLKDQAPTPNIDQIAKEGMIFNRCLVTNSLSGPSRATILTGKYNHINGFLANETTPFDGSQQTFVKLLRNAGYQTAMIGKWHLDSKPTGFDYWNIINGQGQYYNPDFIDSTGMKVEQGYVTEIITKKSIEWLSEALKSGKPFLLMMHHKAPHREWEPGPNELGLYMDKTFPEPPTLFDDYSNRGLAEKEQDMTISKTMRLEEDLKLYKDSSKWKNAGMDRLNPEQRRAWNKVYDPVIKKFYNSRLSGKELIRYKYQRYLQDYLACIAGVDKSVGEILRFLKQNGLDKNTIVVYTSDQGFYLGEHGWFDKRFMFEQSYRTPLLIRWPGVIKPGSVNNDMVSNIDYPETFLDAAGVKIPTDMQGASMLPVLKGQTPKDWRTEHYYHYYEYPGWHSVKRHYGISTKRYKLIHYYYDIDQWELFDREKDPLELRNVYDDPSYKNVRDELHVRLKRLMYKYHDSDSLAQSFLPKTKVSSH